MNDSIHLRWLDSECPKQKAGTSFGVPWNPGEAGRRDHYQLRTSEGNPIPLQTWPLAYWPDGSVKWTAHAAGPAVRTHSAFTLEKVVIAKEHGPDILSRQNGHIVADTGALVCEISESGTDFISSLKVRGCHVLQSAQLVCILTSDAEVPEEGRVESHSYDAVIHSAVIEQNGPLRALVKLEGTLAKAGVRAILPFVLRLYFYAGSDLIRVMHTFVFDGDEKRDFIRALGLRFAVPLTDPLHDRHVRFGGENRGLWAEGVRNLTGLRRNPGTAIKEAQLAGKKCPSLDAFSPAVSTRLDYIPSWNDYSLTQLSPLAFSIRKRTKAGCPYIQAAHGQRSGGSVYLGGASGGVAFGIRNFWQSFPGELEIQDATTREGKVNLWLWSPKAQPMDLRFYHDGLGQDDYSKQLEGLEISYEDYEDGFGTPQGIARTSEIFIQPWAATPNREEFADFTELLQNPPQLICMPERFVEVPVFGALWALPDTSNKTAEKLESHLNWLITYYRTQIEQHHWYGFWNYGDIMHTYDADRHVWRYDVGGFAWDNSELSSDLWLWYSFLRTGRADIYRMAEAMTRHTGEVDVYHLGPFAGLGSRHNVLHWGCSAKQARISSSIFRRIYYYLSTDERVGDLMREVRDVDQKVRELIPLRKYPELWDRKLVDSGRGVVSVGTDWCSFAINWLTEWERFEDLRYRDKIMAGMKSIGLLPHGWFECGQCYYDPETGILEPVNPGKIEISHLQAVFGAPEFCAEILTLIKIPEYKAAWLEYCTMYNAPEKKFMERFGVKPLGRSLIIGHSRLTAFAAKMTGDKALARRAWEEFFRGDEWGPGTFDDPSTKIIQGTASLAPVVENPYASTNSDALWALAAIQNLALIGDALPDL